MTENSQTPSPDHKDQHKDCCHCCNKCFPILPGVQKGKCIICPKFGRACTFGLDHQLITDRSIIQQSTILNHSFTTPRRTPILRGRSIPISSKTIVHPPIPGYVKEVVAPPQLVTLHQECTVIPTFQMRPLYYQVTMPIHLKGSRAIRSSHIRHNSSVLSQSNMMERTQSNLTFQPNNPELHGSSSPIQHHGKPTRNTTQEDENAHSMKGTGRVGEFKLSNSRSTFDKSKLKISMLESKSKPGEPMHPDEIRQLINSFSLLS